MVYLADLPVALRVAVVAHHAEAVLGFVGNDEKGNSGVHAVGNAFGMYEGNDLRLGRGYRSVAIIDGNSMVDRG